MTDWPDNVVDELTDAQLKRLLDCGFPHELRGQLRKTLRKLDKKWKDEQAKEADIQVVRMDISPKGGIDMAFKTPVGRVIAKWVVETMEMNQAPNFLTMSMTHEEAGSFDITLQKVGGITPSQKLTQQREALEAVWKLGLVIESSVRHIEADRLEPAATANYPAVVEMLHAVKVALETPNP